MRILVSAVLLALAPLGAAYAAQPQRNVMALPSSTTTGSDQVVCRTEVETDSLVRTRRRCYTKAQWEQLAYRLQERVGDMIINFRQ